MCAFVCLVRQPAELHLIFIFLIIIVVVVVFIAAVVANKVIFLCDFIFILFDMRIQFQ